MATYGTKKYTTETRTADGTTTAVDVLGTSHTVNTYLAGNLPPLGSVVYGDTGGVISLNVQPFVATALDYDRVFVSWKNPTGAFTEFRLVRNQSGIPDTPEDGVVLIDQATAPTTPYFMDFNQATPLVSGKYVYYSVWVFNGTNWQLLGSTFTLLAARHETALGIIDGASSSARTRTTHEKLMDLLPRVYTSSTAGSLDEVDYTSTLADFMYGFAYTLDEMMTYIDQIAPEISGTAISPNLLDIKSGALNLSTENRASTRFQRQLLREIKWIYSRKGTSAALDDAITNMTGYNTTVTPSPNLMLSVNDSTFINWKSYSSWIARFQATITGATSDGTYITYTSVNPFKAGQTVTVSGITSTGFNVNSAVIVWANSSSFKVKVSLASSTTYVSGGTATIPTVGSYSFWRTVGNCTMSQDLTTLAATETYAIDTVATAKVVSGASGSSISIGNDLPVRRGVPVTQSTAYTLSYYQRSASSSSTIPILTWYGANGAALYSVTGSTQSTTTSWSRAKLTATAPSSAITAVTNLAIASNVVTLTLSTPTPYAVGQSITVSITTKTPTDYTGISGTYTVTAVGTNTVSFSKTYSGSVSTTAVAGVVSSSQQAYYAGITVKFSGALTYWVDMFQLAADSAGTLGYYEARGVTVNIDATKENFLYNPSFETTNYWGVTGSGTHTSGLVATDTGNPPLITGNGSNLFQIVSTSGQAILTASSSPSTATAITDSALVGGQFLVFSVYARTTGATLQPTLTLKATNTGLPDLTNFVTYTQTGSIVGATETASTTTFYSSYPVKVGDMVSVSGVTPSGYNIGSTQVLAVAPPADPTASSSTPAGSPSFTVASESMVGSPYVSGGTVTDTSSQQLTSKWQRFQVNLYLPTAYTAAAITPSFAFTGAGTVQFDAAQLELRYSASDYFDGSYYDAIWGNGTANASDSYMYQNYANKSPRIKTEIVNYLPSNTPYVVTRKDGIATSGPTGSTIPIVGFTP